MKSYKIKNCRICNNNNLEKVFTLKPSALADSYIKKDKLNQKQELFELEFLLCKKCGLFQLETIVEPEDIYNEDYLYKTSTSLGLEEHFIKLTQNLIQKYNLTKNDFIVDIGSNSGSLLKGYKYHNLKILGIEPVPHIAKEANKNGINTKNIFFNSTTAQKIVNEYLKASIIHANNVFANIPDLHDFVEGVKILLDDDGVFIFETSYILSLIKNVVFDTFYHEHISYFALKPLIYLFEKHDLKIIDAELINTKGGSIRCYVEHNKNQSISNNLVNLIDDEIKQGLFDKNIYFNYQNYIESLKQNLLNKLEEYKKNNKKIVGYGASNTTTTLMHHFELASYIDYIVDDNPIKQNKFSPYYHIPVFASEKIYGDNVNVIILFAWRFKEAIIKKHIKFLESGGIFLVPLPVIKIINKDNL